MAVVTDSLATVHVDEQRKAFTSKNSIDKPSRGPQFTPQDNNDKQLTLSHIIDNQLTVAKQTAKVIDCHTTVTKQMALVTDSQTTVNVKEQREACPSSYEMGPLSTGSLTQGGQ